MIEEPYRWVEATANRREYIETQLAAGSPIAAVGYRDGILFVTLGRARQKIFEIYDRIGMAVSGDRIGEHRGFHAFGRGRFTAPSRPLLAQPGDEECVRASLWRPLSGAA